MSEPILPRGGAGQTNVPGALRTAGHRYITKLGWSVFLEREGADGVRRPLPLCDDCRSAGPGHDRELCPCLGCHGFYAATRDHARWDRMCDAVPDATHICVRTGHASGIFVVDLDVKHSAPQLLDPATWHTRTKLNWTLPETRRHRTRSGGFHLVYALPPDRDVGSHNGVYGLRGVDVKGDGGLVVVPPSPGYTVDPGSGGVAEPGEALLSWARDARGGYWNGGEGGLGEALPLGDLARSDESCPAGLRDAFCNALLFTYRRSGYTETHAAALIRPHWERMEGRGTADEFRWEWIEYKIRRIWQTVVPDPDVIAGRRWHHAVAAGITPSEGEVRRVGGVTLIGRRATGGRA